MILEVALLGVRNFQKVTRLEFCPGLNLVLGNNGSGKTTLRDALLWGLLGQSREQAQTLYGRSGSAACQAAITFKAQNGEVYRLAKDFMKDIGILSKLDTPTQKFIPIEKRKDNVLRWLQQQCGGLDGQRIAHYFSLDRYRLPSNLPGRGKPQQTEVSTLVDTTRLQSLKEPTVQGESVDKVKRLQELKKSAEKAEQAFQIEEQLTDTQSRVGVLKRKLSDLKKVEQELEQINERAAVFAGLEGTIEQLEQFIEEFEERLRERNREHQTLEEDRSLLEHQLNFIPTDPVYKNKLFLSGVGITALSLGIGLFLTLPGLYQHLYLLGLLIGIGLLGASIVIDMRWQSRKKLLEDKLQNKLKNTELLEARFRRENAKFFDLLKKTNTDSLDGFKEKVKAYELLRVSRKRLMEEKERILEGKEQEALKKEYQEKLALMEDLQKKLKNYEGIPADLPSLREEISILEKEVAAQKRFPLQQSITAEKDTQASLTQLTNPSSRPGNGTYGPIGGLLQDPLIPDRPKFFGTVREIFQKVSSGANLDLAFDASCPPDEQITLTPVGSSTPLQLKELSPGILDQIFLSIYLGLLMNLGPDYNFPVLLDDPFLTLDQKRQEMILEVLREIGKSRQVILLSYVPYPPKNGDRQIRLAMT